VVKRSKRGGEGKNEKRFFGRLMVTGTGALSGTGIQ